MSDRELVRRPLPGDWVVEVLLPGQDSHVSSAASWPRIPTVGEMLLLPPSDGSGIDITGTVKVVFWQPEFRTVQIALTEM